MPRFLAVHTMPLSEKEVLESTKAQASQVPEGVTWERAYCNFSDGKFFCEYESPSREVLEEGFRAAEVPFDEIHSVRLFDVSAGELEPE